MIDIHNHVLVGTDDGPQTEEEAVMLLQQAIDNGITDIIATPHHYSGDFVNPGSKVLEKMDTLNQIISQHQLDINVHPGQEIRVNGNFVEELKSGASIPLNQSQYVLVEFSFNDIPNYVDPLLYDLQMSGYTPLIAHPERCKPIIKYPDKLYDFIEKGAIAQVTAGSVAGALGENLKETSLKMIEAHLVHIIASDAHHAELRPFMLKEAYDVVEKELGSIYVEDLKNNAEAVLQGKEVKVKRPSKIETHYKSSKKRKKKKFLGLF
ncbi:tyrosine-protein phosphatase [Salinicoccus luteus]|uniref:tyrosine-protein phosphatase n=1 Tax=Salinicoccus luteus TaxID=367840 RepID=UPI0004E27C5C|nr:CpsB/CapC family capsule biosynthesis tyrosine phosphatase [Salinicoccus luteus]